jgi:hypothetical protein
MFLDLPYPDFDPLVRGTDPDLDPIMLAKENSYTQF